MIWNYLKITIICVAVLICAFGSVLAIEFNLLIDPEFEFFHPGYARYFYETEKHIIVQLQMANNDGIEWCAYSIPLRIFGTGMISSVAWVEAGGTMEPSIVHINGFEMGGGIWGLMNAIYTWSWDGNLNILDIVYIINFKYKAGPQPLLPDLCDVNNDSDINILDVVRMINFKYKDGSALNCPVWELL